VDVLELQGEQLQVFVESVSHFTDKVRGKYLILDAPGGTGKTYVMRKVVSYMSKFGRNLTVIAFTGRAASQLAKDGVTAQTCHSLLYKPRFDSNDNLIGWDEKTKDEILEVCRDGIVADEASMIPYKMHKALDALGVQILYAGDTEQLPPVEPDGTVFNAMCNVPGHVITLRQNRRFGTDTGIGYIANHLRTQDSIPRIKKPGLSYVRKSSVLTEQFHVETRFDVVLCGMNKTRKKINTLIRYARGYTTELPTEGETVVCLRNGILSNGVKINNGELFTVEGVLEGSKTSKYILRTEDGTNIVTVEVLNTAWDSEQSPSVDGKTPLQLFGFGYCLSVHKSQGSTFKSVLFVDEDVSFFLERKKFRYTGATRAAEHLCIAI
jgi:exodeoxyribonuclease-5